MRSQLVLDHEQYRKDIWEPLKHFRGRFDSERIISETIMESADIQRQKKEMDKLIINSIRIAI